MSGDIVNLRRARKARARADGHAKAAENRARFGRTRAERERETAEEALAARRLDGMRREEGSGGDGHER